jgi:cell division protein FtsL
MARRKARLTKGEKMLYTLAFVCFLGIVVTKIFLGASITNLSMSVEQAKYDIESQEKKNESLTMKVNELTSFDKVKDIVSEMGLAYNNDNIIIIND